MLLLIIVRYLLKFVNSTLGPEYIFPFLHRLYRDVYTFFMAAFSVPRVRLFAATHLDPCYKWTPIMYIRCMLGATQQRRPPGLSRAMIHSSCLEVTGEATIQAWRAQPTPVLCILCTKHYRDESEMQTDFGFESGVDWA